MAAPAPPSAAFLAGSERVESPLPKGNDGQRLMPTGCNDIPFKPTTSQSPGTNQTDSPMGGTVEVTVPFDPPAAIYQSNVRNADVSLPQGMGLNPSSANGLQACTDAQFGKGTRNPVACPAGSKIGTVAIDTPPLPDGTLTGNVYLGTQQSRDPASGNEYRIFIDAESASRGLSIRLLGNVSANPADGPADRAGRTKRRSCPFSSVRVTLDGGKGTLTSPPTCGPNKTSSRDDRLVGHARRRAPGQRLHPHHRPGWRALRENPGRAALRPRFRHQQQQSQGRRLHPVRAERRRATTAIRS